MILLPQAASLQKPTGLFADRSRPRNDVSAKNPSPKPFLLLLGEGAEVLIVLAPGPAVVDNLVDGAPVGEAADSAVVDEEVGVELAGADAGLVDFLAGVVAVDGEELKAALFAEVDSLLQEPAFTGGP